MKIKLITASLALTLSFVSSSVFAKNNKQTGTIVGGVIGAVIGNQFGGGNGKTIATAIGAIAGAAIGSSIGEQLDQTSQTEMSYTQARALERAERQSRWRGQNYYGDFYVHRTGYYNTYECRSYENRIYNMYGNLVEARSGTTCYTSSGWTEVRESSIRWY